MKKIVIYGARYFDIVKTIAAINILKPTYEILGYIDDDPKTIGKSFLGYKVLGSKTVISELIKQKDVFIFNNINVNLTARKKIHRLLENHLLTAPSIIHPSVDLNFVECGRGCFFSNGVLIGSNTKIGDYLTTRLKSVISHDVVIGNNVTLAPSCTICSHSKIGDDCFIGAGSTISNNLTVGKGSVIGAGSLVVNNIPENVLAFGSPAKIIKTISRKDFFYEK